MNLTKFETLSLLENIFGDELPETASDLFAVAEVPTRRVVYASVLGKIPSSPTKAYSSLVAEFNEFISEEEVLDDVVEPPVPLVVPESSVEEGVELEESEDESDES